MEESLVVEIVEHLKEQFDLTGRPLTRFQIGSILKDYDYNTGENMKLILGALAFTKVKVL